MDKNERKEYVKELKERFEFFQIDLSKELLVDKETGIEYLYLSGSGFQSLLNVEGKPMINKKFQDGLL